MGTVMWSEYLRRICAQAAARQQLVLFRPQVQDDVGAARGLLDRFDRVVALAGAFPLHAVIGGRAGPPGDQRHAVGDDEGGIEADAELPDQVGVLGAVGGELLDELAGAGLGDGADLVDDLLPRHPDAVVRHGDGPRRRIEADADPHVGVVFEQPRVAHGLEPQLVGGIRSVRRQLAQEDLLVAVERVDHQVEELFDLRLEAECFAGRR